MKDRRVIALERVLSRRRELERKLNTQLTQRRAAARELEAELAQRREAVTRQTDELGRQDGKIDAMLGGRSFRADELLKLRDFRSLSAERHAALEADAAQAGQALAEGEAAVHAARGEIVRNRARVDIYSKRCAKLVSALAAAIEDAQEEEISESRRPGPRPF